MPTEQILIIVRERGSRVVKRNIRDIGRSSKRAAKDVGLLGRSLRLLGIGLIARELQRMNDVFVTTQNRLRLVTRGTRELTSTTESLFNIAERTRSSYETTAELFSRVALTLGILGGAVLGNSANADGDADGVRQSFASRVAKILDRPESDVQEI